MRFVEAVNKYFLFLKSTYNFKVLTINDSYIRFESARVFINIQIDSGRTFEISITLGELSKKYENSERAFGLDEILRMQKVNENTYILATSIDAIDSSAERLSFLLQKHCKEFLKGSELEFMRLSKYRDSQCTAYEERVYLEQKRKEAELAWKNKNFQSVVDAYLSIENHLSPAEVKKLSYSKTKL